MTQIIMLSHKNDMWVKIYLDIPASGGAIRVRGVPKLARGLRAGGRAGARARGQAAAGRGAGRANERATRRLAVLVAVVGAPARKEDTKEGEEKEAAQGGL